MLGIFICTRKRVEGLRRLLDSIESNVKNPDEIEVWIGYDDDDDQTDTFAKECNYSFSVFTHSNSKKSAECRICGKKYVNRHKDIINPMAFGSSSDIFWVLNDDIEIKTKDFDEIIHQTVDYHMSGKEYRIFYGMCDIKFTRGGPPYFEDVAGRGAKRLKTTYSCYPIVTRELASALGYFLCDHYPDDAADILLGKVVGNSWFNRKYKVEVTVTDTVVKEDRDTRIRPLGDSPEAMRDYNAKLLSGKYTCHHLPLVPSLSDTVERGVTRLNSIIDQKFLYQEEVPLAGIDINLTYECSNCGNLVSMPCISYIKGAATCSHCGTPNMLQQITLENISNSIGNMSDTLQGIFDVHCNYEEQKKKEQVDKGAL